MSREAVLETLRFVRRNQHRLDELSLVDLGWQEPDGSLRDRLIKDSKKPAMTWRNRFHYDTSELVIGTKESPISHSILLHDGRLATACHDAAIRFWDPLTGELLDIFTEQADSELRKRAELDHLITQLSPQILLTASHDRALAWNLENGTVIDVLKDVGWVRAFVAHGGSTVLVMTHTDEKFLWEIPFEPRSEDFVSFYKSPCPWLAASSDKVLWLTGNSIRRIDPRFDAVWKEVVRSSEPLSGVRALDEKLLCVWTKRGTAEIWDLVTKTKQEVDGLEGVESLTPMGNGLFLAETEDRKHSMWQAKPIPKLMALYEFKPSFTHFISLDDNRFLMAGQSIFVCSKNSSSVLDIWLGHEREVSDIIQLNDPFIATGSFDGSVRVWDKSIFHSTVQGHGVGGIERIVSLNQTTILTINDDEEALLWNIDSVEIIGRESGFRLHVCLAKDGQIAFTRERDVWIWSPSQEPKCLNLMSSLRQLNIPVSGLQNWSISSSPGGRLAIVPAHNVIIILDSPYQGKPTIHHLPDQITFDRYRRALWLGEDTLAILTSDQSMRLLKVRDKGIEVITTWNPVPHRSFYRASADVCAIKHEESIHVYSGPHFNTPVPLQALSGNVDCLVGFGDSLLATSSSDQTIRIWDTKTGECLRSIPATGPSKSHLLATKDDRLVTCDFEGKLEVWDPHQGRKIGETASPSKPPAWPWPVAA